MQLENYWSDSYVVYHSNVSSFCKRNKNGLDLES